MGIADDITTEILVILKACELCSSKESLFGRVIMVASDSSSAVSWVNISNGIGSLKHVNNIYNNRSFLANSDGRSVVFNPRGSNSFANNLAKRGSLMSGDQVH